MLLQARRDAELQLPHRFCRAVAWMLPIAIDDSSASRKLVTCHLRSSARWHCIADDDALLLRHVMSTTRCRGLALLQRIGARRARAMLCCAEIDQRVSAAAAAIATSQSNSRFESHSSWRIALFPLL